MSALAESRAREAPCRALANTESCMNYAKKVEFSERLSAQAEATKALLAKMKTKPTVVAESLVDRQARREAELEAVRAQRAAERETARLAREAREAEERRLKEEAEALAAAARKAERKEWKQSVKAEKMDAKARRAARYADLAKFGSMEF